MFIVNSYWFVPSTSYLLDTYSAAAAYSLRQLKTGVTNVVRVRRSSDNAESDFTATEITDGTLATWSSGTDSFVVDWYDQSGNGAGYGVSQSTAASQGKIVSSGTLITKGGEPAVLFDGTDDHYGNGTNYPNTTNVSFFSVSASDTLSYQGFLYAVTENNTTDRVIGIHDTRNTPIRNVLYQEGGNTYAADLSAARNDTNQRLLSSFIDSSKNISAFDNGATGGTATAAGTITPTVLYIGRQATNLSNTFSGYFQEFIAFNTDESANRTAIESDIDTHYWGADLLLDTYTGAAAAYSLRKLSKFTTNVVRVRRSSDNAESDFTADEITDGTLTTWTGANDGFVVTWYDQSGSSNNVTMSTAANQGKIVSSGSVINENGKPCVQMDGTNDRYASVSSVTGSLAKSVISVSNITNTNARIYTFNDNNRGLRNTSGDNLTIRGSLDVDITVVGSGSSRGQTLIESYRAGGSNTVETFYDSSTGGSAVTGSYNDGTLTWGADLAAALPMSGTIQELIISETDHKANRTAIESDINTYYSIY